MNELPKLYQLFQSGNCKLVFELLEGLDIDKIDFLEMMFNDCKVLDDEMNKCIFTTEYLEAIVLNEILPNTERNKSNIIGYDLWINNCGWHNVINRYNDACNYMIQDANENRKFRDFLKIIIDEIRDNG